MQSGCVAVVLSVALGALQRCTDIFNEICMFCALTSILLVYSAPLFLALPLSLSVLCLSLSFCVGFLEGDSQSRSECGLCGRANLVSANINL